MKQRQRPQALGERVPRGRRENDHRAPADAAGGTQAVHREAARQCGEALAQLEDGREPRDAVLRGAKLLHQGRQQHWGRLVG
eukprot:CAMPEP_0175609136 /NCGR_PEP_ID=MMETSP0096-20121207/62108_1 /TAXON_ID=311494 /ORGANISM="Alexandrium monilatum, Strain CCMP3105" /LENGTH=81 /DNA_ID=CAMNT_0016914053 /DNA_START=15 /DNA_END=256 /DNA_ORIENTATION=+